MDSCVHCVAVLYFALTLKLLTVVTATEEKLFYLNEDRQNCGSFTRRLGTMRDDIG